MRSGFSTAGGTNDAARRREEKGERGKETNGAASFVELRAHSAFSFGDGTATPEALVDTAAKLGYSALGLTDVADFGGVVRFALAAWEAGITPLIGAELIVDGAPIALLARTARVVAISLRSSPAHARAVSEHGVPSRFRVLREGDRV